jgi:O-antigen ligase
VAAGSPYLRVTYAETNRILPEPYQRVLVAAIAVAALALVGLRFKKLTIVAIPFAVAVGIYLAQDLISTDQYSWGTRVDAWLVVLDIRRVSPIIGLGFANYYFYAKVFTIRGYHIKFNSHSQFVDLVAQTGILGLLCFFWILFEVGRLAWDLSLRSSRSRRRTAARRTRCGCSNAACGSSGSTRNATRRGRSTRRSPEPRTS